jgi:hypothetical protein
MKTVPRFTDVQAILDRLVGDRKDFLKEIHGESFGWSTWEELVNAVVEPGGARTYRLIDPELAKQGRGAETNLIIALTRGVDSFSRMPLDGPYASEAELQTLIDWINTGCPRNP